MSDVAPLRPQLERRFGNHRIVFWHERQVLPAIDMNNLELGKRISL